MATCKQCREFEKCKDDAFINGAKFDPNESAKYCTGFEPITNADRIRAMSDEELAEFIRSMVDDDCSHEVACYGCINYGTHHSDPANKGTNLYECDGCSNEGVGLDILKWLKQPAEDRQ